MVLVRLYVTSRRIFTRLIILLQAMFDGFWLGVLNPASLASLDESYYNESSIYITKDYNKRGLSKWEKEMLSRYFRDRRNLILIGAGGGREVYALRKMGYAVDAFECNRKLREFGNSLLQSEGLPRCIGHVERDSVPDGSAGYEGAIVGWGAFMLMQGRSRRVEFLRSVCTRLVGGSPILLSFYSRSPGGRRFQLTATVANVFRVLLRREKVEAGDSLAPNYVHYFTEAELSEEMGEAGFELIHYSTSGYGHAVARVVGMQNTTSAPVSWRNALDDPRGARESVVASSLGKS